MQSISRSDGLTLTDSPGCFWFLGGLFCVIGSGAVLAAIATASGKHAAGQVVLTILLGLAGIGAGIFSIYNAPVSRVEISRTHNLLTVSHRGLFRRQLHSFSLSSVECVYLVEKKDVDGGPVYAIRVQLAGGQELPLTHLWLHNRAKLEETLARLSEYLPRGETRVTKSLR